MDSFDLIVIGSGPAGQRAALQGAKAGKKVVIIEAHPAVGGGCVHSGTIPSKSFRESVYRYSLGSRGALGQAAESAVTRGERRTRKLPDMKRLLRRRDRVVSGESQVIFDQLKRNQVSIIHGTARLTSSHTVEVTSTKGRKELKGRFIFVAVGSGPTAPVHLGVDHKVILDSDSILTLKNMPRTMVVLGAGVIGAEYASMFSMAGTQVTLVDRRDQMLASVDREIVSHLMDRFHHDKMEIVLGCEAKTIEVRKVRGKKSARVHLSNGKKIDCEVVLIALGRCGNTGDLGLHALGVELDDRGLVKVDPHFRTNVPSVYAVGDVVGAPALAATSYEQGRIACCHAFQLDREGVAVETQMPVNYPYGIYTIPEISMIGKTEEELGKSEADFVVGRSRYRELARGQIVGDRWGLLKLLVDRKTLKLLGVHIIGDNAADLIHIGQAVMAFEGDVNYFIRSVFNYPTLAEAYKTAAFHAINQLQGNTLSK